MNREGHPPRTPVARAGIALIFALLLHAGQRAFAEAVEPWAPVLVEARRLAAGPGGDAGSVAARRPDQVWQLADALAALGADTRALELAEVLPPDERTALRTYLAARRPAAEAVDAWQRLDAVSSLLAANDLSAAEVALARFDSREETVIQVGVARQRAALLQAQKRTLGALDELSGGAEIARRLGWTSEAQRVLHAGGDLAYSEAGDPEVALDLWKRAMDVAAARGDRTAQAHLDNGMGAAWADLGLLDRALEHLTRARAHFRAQGALLADATVSSNLGLIELRRGRFARALEAEEEALDLLRESASIPAADRDAARQLAALAAIWKGVVFEALGRPEAAIREYRAVLDTARANGLSADVVAYAAGNLGSACIAVGDLDGAEASLRLALGHFDEERDRTRAASTMANLGEVLSRRGDVEGAVRLHVDALRTLIGANQSAAAAEVRAGLAEALHRGGHLFYAHMLHGVGVREAAASGATGLRVRSLAGLAEVAWSRGRRAEALAHVIEADQDLQRLRLGLDDEQEVALRTHVGRMYAIGVAAALREGDVGRAVEMLELSRAGALRTALAVSAGATPAQVPVGTLRDVARARSEAQAARGSWLQAVADGRPRAEQTRLRGLADEGMSRLAGALARLQRAHRLQGDLLYPHVAPLRELASVLKSDEALVLFACPDVEIDDHAWAVVVRNGESRIRDLGPVAEIEAKCAALREACADRTDSGDGKDGTNRAGHLRVAAGRVRAVLLPKLGLGEDVRRLLISPDGPFSDLPLSVVLGDRGFALVPSGTVYAILRGEASAAAPSRGAMTVAGFGDPDYGHVAGGIPSERLPYSMRLERLPGTRREVEAAADRKFLGRDATEAQLRGLLAGMDPEERLGALLLAGHGIPNDEHPSLSGIALTADGDDDGFLTALEVLQLRVSADLVVLSACESGRGKSVRGEGILGLVRAFMFAGAHRVLASLWKVDDEATEVLMTHFFKRLKAGDPPAKALRSAQDEVRAKKPEWKDPYYWAAWVLWGLPD